MECYFIVSQEKDHYVLENLITRKTHRVIQQGSHLYNIDNGNSSSIIKILPSNYSLSVFGNNKGNFVYKAENDHLLFDITDNLVKYSDTELTQNDIIATSEWQQ